LLTWIGLAMTLVILAYELTALAKNLGWLQVTDFMSFWTAGRLNVTGLNPYDNDQLLRLQKEIGWDERSAMTWWNPPWALLLYMPFGLLSYSLARALWLIVNLAIVFFCAEWLWRFYGGPPRYRWLALLISLFFFPTIFVLSIGQNVPFILLGIVGFLHSIKNQKPYLAGVCAVLVAIKPHLFLPFWMALIFWVIDRRCWSVLLGMGLAGLAATAILLGVNPAVISQYIYVIPTGSNYLANFSTPTFGTVLRMLLGFDKSWLQFIPLGLGAIWFLLHWTKHRRTWEWGEQMPLLLLVSLVTAFYTWSYDQMVLLVAVMQVAVLTFRHNRGRTLFWTIIPYLIFNSLPFILQIPADFSRIWMAPSFLVWYWLVREHVGQQQFQALSGKDNLRNLQ